MKLRIASLFLALLTLLTLASCSASDLNPDDGWHPAGYKLASGEHVDYNLFVPEAWTVDISTGVTTAFTAGGNVSMVATSVEKGTTLAAFWKEYETQFDPAFVDFKYVNEGQDILLDSGKVPAKKYIYTATVTGNAYQFYQVIAIIDSTAYIFTFTALAPKFDSLVAQADAMIGYLTFDAVKNAPDAESKESGEIPSDPESEDEAAGGEESGNEADAETT